MLGGPGHTLLQMEPLGPGIDSDVERNQTEVLLQELLYSVHVRSNPMLGVPVPECNFGHQGPLTIEINNLDSPVAHRLEEKDADSPQPFGGVIQTLLPAPARRHQTTMDRLNSSTHSLAFFSSLAV